MVPYEDLNTIGGGGEGRRLEHEGFLFVCFCVNEKVRNITLHAINESLDRQKWECLYSMLLGKKVQNHCTREPHFYSFCSIILI